MHSGREGGKPHCRLAPAVRPRGVVVQNRENILYYEYYYYYYRQHRVRMSERTRVLSLIIRLVEDGHG